MAPVVDTNGMRGMKTAELLKRLEDGLVPYNEIKQLIKVQLERRLQWGYKPTYEQQTAQLLNFAHSLREMQIANETETMDSQLYEVPVSFLEIIHGPTLKQSCCYFKDQSTTLELAEILMLDLYCEKAQINDGMSVLDLGCGQGSLTLHIARKYKKCHVMAITNSVSQKEYIEERCKCYSLSNVEVILVDVMKHDMVETFDRVMVIGLFEHMKNYELFLRKISKWMSQEGLLFVDHVCHKTFPYHFEPLDGDDWYTEYVFAGDAIIIPSSSFLLYFQDDVSVVDHWILSGKHFSRSNEEWLKRLDREVDAIKVILEPSLGSEEAVMKTINYWRGFFLSGMEMFGYNNGEEWMISHVLFKKK